MNDFTEDIFAQWLDAKMKAVHTDIPGEIQSYDESTKKATVKPLIKLRTNQDDILTIPPIDNVPVMMFIVKGFALDFPLEKGDGGLIIFAEEGIGDFLNGKVEVTADDFSRFNLTDAIFLPGLWGFNNRPESRSKISIDSDGNINVTAPTGTSISLGDNPAKQLVNDYIICPITGAPHVIANKQVKV